MNIKKILSLILFIIVTIAILKIYSLSQVKIEMNTNVPKLNELTEIYINITKWNRPLDVEEINVNLYHKHKKDEKLNTTIKPYSEGKFQLVYYPQIQGDYLVDIDCEVDGEVIYKNEKIEVE